MLEENFSMLRSLEISASVVEMNTKSAKNNLTTVKYVCRTGATQNVGRFLSHDVSFRRHSKKPEVVFDQMKTEFCSPGTP